MVKKLSALVVAGGVALAGAAQAESVAPPPAKPEPVRISVQQLVEQADADNARAQMLLATMHLKGAVKDADAGKAVQLLERAGAKGHVPAQALLAELYLKGKGVAADPARARALLQRAAEAGHPHSQYNLAVMMFTGSGGDRDPVQGVKWLALASATGDAAMRAKVDAKLKPVGQTLSKAHLTEGFEAARQWLLLKQ